MSFGSKILKWYHQNKRELPWRQDVSPYFTWLSEVILQQTRVNQGLPYFNRFIRNYPTIQHLANASEDRVLKDWQGLGYYSRARNMHKAAKMVSKDYGGIFPSEFNKILMLPGVGHYTASAIASICFNQPYPVVDGNVQRVVSRIFGITQPVNTTLGKEEVMQVLQEIFDQDHPGDFNQAIMEFGALQCKPQSPNCKSCIFNTTCIAYHKDMVNVLPIKNKKSKPKERFFLYIVPQRGDMEFVVQRTSNDIWKNLFEFPLIELPKRLKRAGDKELLPIMNELSINGSIEFISPEFKHVLTHRIIYARFIIVRLSREFKPPATWRKKTIGDESGFAFPVLIQKFLTERNAN